MASLQQQRGRECYVAAWRNRDPWNGLEWGVSRSLQRSRGDPPFNSIPSLLPSLTWVPPWSVSSCQCQLCFGWDLLLRDFEPWVLQQIARCGEHATKLLLLLGVERIVGWRWVTAENWWLPLECGRFRVFEWSPCYGRCWERSIWVLCLECWLRGWSSVTRSYGAICCGFVCFVLWESGCHSSSMALSFSIFAFFGCVWKARASLGCEFSLICPSYSTFISAAGIFNVCKSLLGVKKVLLTGFEQETANFEWWEPPETSISRMGMEHQGTR